jgi:hypothetical protein
MAITRDYSILPFPLSLEADRRISPSRGEQRCRASARLALPSSALPSAVDPALHPARFTIEGAELGRAGQNFISRRHIRCPRGLVATLPANLKNVRHLDESRRAPSASTPFPGRP